MTVSLGVSVADPAGRRRLQRIAVALIGYGSVGIIVAIVALVALVMGLGRVNDLGSRLVDDIAGMSRTLERTATVLDDAGSTAHGFAATIDGTTSALGTIGGDLRDIVPRLQSLQQQTSAINILGTQPLQPIAGLFGQIASQLEDVQGQLDSVRAGLAGNQTGLAKNADSLANLASETRSLSLRLGGDALPGAVDDIRWLLVALLGIAALGAAMPAVAALVVGIWLRRLID